MATIYRFIVEQGTSKKSGGRTSGGNSDKKTAKTTTLLKLLGGSEKGGVEHNRKMRAFMPLAGKLVPNFEKYMRLGRAGLGLFKFKMNKSTGKYEFAGLSGSAIAIIIALAIQTTMKHHNKLIEKEQKVNTLNYKQLETGQSLIHSSYETSVNIWSGKITYNQNK